MELEEDRISQLPQHILHHLLSLLPRKDAVRTCILSKSWRHLVSTRPTIEFYDSFVVGRNPKSLSVTVLENTLQRYVDQKLPLQQLILRVSGSDSKSSSILNKWIPIVLMNMGVKVFSLSSEFFSLPSVILQAELLEKLHLFRCKLINNCNIVVKLHMLKRLSLRFVWIEEETFEKIMSSSPLIEHLVLEGCVGLTNVKVNKEARNLKHFDCFLMEEDGSIEIDDSTSLKTIKIRDCGNWYHHNNKLFFPGLKSLFLQDMHLSRETLINLSSNFPPCLEQLVIVECSGFDEFKLSSRSIKRLIIKIANRPIKAAIDAANMLYFEYRGGYVPSFSFARTSNEWKSCIEVWPWSEKLHEFLKALSQSQISLYLSDVQLRNQGTFGDHSCEPVVVEHLYLREYCPSYEVPAFLNCVFRICRPRYIRLFLNSNSEKICERQLGESIWNTLVNKGETRECDFWQQDLEESSIQVSDKKANEWRPGQVCEFSNNEGIRFKLKWRDLS